MVVKNIHTNQLLTEQKVEQNKIVQMLQSGNSEVINLLYDDYSDALYGVVLRIVNSEEIAKDVIQDVFVKIWKNGSKYDPAKATLFTWMLNIARNTAIDVTRSSYFKKTLKNRELNSNVYNSGNFSWQNNVDQIGLQKLVNGLDEKYRVVVDLIYFKGYTQKEVQEHLDIPIGTVKSRVRIGLRELRKLFANIVMLPIIFSNYF